MQNARSVSCPRVAALTMSCRNDPLREPWNKQQDLPLINQAGGLYGRILSKVVSTG